MAQRELQGEWSQVKTRAIPSDKKRPPASSMECKVRSKTHVAQRPTRSCDVALEDAASQLSAMTNGRCRMDGGVSTGPRTAEGLARSRRARWKHGLYSAGARAEQKLARELLQQRNLN